MALAFVLGQARPLELRTERGLTQRDLPAMARVARSTLVAIETGKGALARIDAIEKLLVGVSNTTSTRSCGETR